MITHFETVTKRKAESNLFQLCVTLHKCFVFVICRHFTLNWLKVLKLSKIFLKMIWSKPGRQTQNDQNIMFLNERIPFINTVDLTSVVSND